MGSKTLTIQDVYSLALTQLEQIMSADAVEVKYQERNQSLFVAIAPRIRAAEILNCLFLKALDVKRPKPVVLTFLYGLTHMTNKDLDHVQHTVDTMRENRYRAQLTKIFCGGGVDHGVAGMLAICISSNREAAIEGFNAGMDTELPPF